MLTVGRSRHTIPLCPIRYLGTVTMAQTDSKGNWMSDLFQSNTRLTLTFRLDISPMFQLGWHRLTKAGTCASTAQGRLPIAIFPQGLGLSYVLTTGLQRSRRCSSPCRKSIGSEGEWPMVGTSSQQLNPPNTALTFPLTPFVRIK